MRMATPIKYCKQCFVFTYSGCKMCRECGHYFYIKRKIRSV